jgi:ribosomal RNA-processing protein 8
MPALSALQQKFAAQLAGGHFRSLNERLYTQPGSASLAMMQRDPSLFAAYHAGFRKQAAAWPVNPLDALIGELRRAPAGGVVADFGCGDARLAEALGAHATVHSFDLVAANARVTACDMARVPLPAAACSAVVFCLSLMGTNYMDFLAEGARVLKPGGWLLVAEIRSRFGAGGAPGESAAADAGLAADGAAGGGGGGGAGKSCRKRRREGGEGGAASAQGEAPAPADDGVARFITAVKRLGLTLERQGGDKMFVRIVFRKTAAPAASESGTRDGGGGGAAALKPCVYKKR